MDKLTKTFTADDLKVDEGSREVVAVISTQDKDRDGEIVLPQGLKRKNYGGNSVVLVNHDMKSLPIGTTRWIKRDGNRLIAKYYITDKTQFANDVFNLLQDGVLMAHSVGMIPHDIGPPTTKELNSNPEWADAKNIIRKWELLEFSVVAVPSNPQAMAMAVAKNYSPETFDFLGDEWAPTPPLNKDVWAWDDDANSDFETAAKSGEPQAIIPAPTYARSWRETSREVVKRFNVDERDIIDRLKGRV